MEEEIFLSAEIATPDAYKLIFEAGFALQDEMVSASEEMRMSVAHYIGGLFDSVREIEEDAKKSGATEAFMTFGGALKPISDTILAKSDDECGEYLPHEIGDNAANAHIKVVAALQRVDKTYEGGESLSSIDLKPGISPLDYFKGSKLTAEHIQGLIFEYQQNRFPGDELHDREDLMRVRYLRSLSAFIDVRVREDATLASGKTSLDVAAIMQTAHKAIAVTNPDIEPYANEMDMQLAHHYMSRYLG